ncbi:hypothetical protein CAOG_009756 [Capsaspora owczarzaki ATCC 30864]|uniref:Uncharacterized protein n=1 Tax=Capsaspora owczarzaki (strain ATCC 30864) TaxID=595528 RepID=A0A0D2X311_CAPO3|nr:hypothetical protein CAOG_009756 [Capsaspora owczarzaki ATCC 30864]
METIDEAMHSHTPAAELPTSQTQTAAAEPQRPTFKRQASEQLDDATTTAAEPVEPVEHDQQQLDEPSQASTEDRRGG